MKLVFFCPHWGSEHLPFAAFAAKVKEAGYDGVEMNLPPHKAECRERMAILDDHDLQWIGQQYLPPAAESVEAYIGRMEHYLYHLASFQPRFINSHTGKDFFDVNANEKAIQKTMEISERTGVKIVHETHRGRFNYCAKATQAYFTRFPELEITADFSHWCCVSESLLEDQEVLVAEACRRATHIHARVGYAQAAQVNHPAAPEHALALARHLTWWQQICQTRKQANAPLLTITPEFGPPPYLPTIPFTNQVIADQWAINLYMKEMLQNVLKTR